LKTIELTIKRASSEKFPDKFRNVIFRKIDNPSGDGDVKPYTRSLMSLSDIETDREDASTKLMSIYGAGGMDAVLSAVHAAVSVRRTSPRRCWYEIYTGPGPFLCPNQGMLLYRLQANIPLFRFCHSLKPVYMLSDVLLFLSNITLRRFRSPGLGAVASW